MNGIEAAIRIRQALPGCKILSSPARLQRPICWKARAKGMI